MCKRPAGRSREFEEVGRRIQASRSQETGFVKVEVVADDPEPAPAPAEAVLLAPGGYRVEGLDLAGLAELLRRLA